VVSTGAGASPPLEILANFWLFVPCGLYLGLIAPLWPWWKVAGAAVGASVLLELAQYGFAVGSSDVTDVIVNAAGGLVGFGLLALARHRFQARTTAAMTRVCSVGTVVAQLAIGILIASPQRYGPREVTAASTPFAPTPDAGTQATVVS